MAKVNSTRKILIALLLIILSAAGIFVVQGHNNRAYASNNIAVAYGDDIDTSYVIDEYEASIDCSKGREAVIEENITVTFDSLSHGIYRDLTTASGEDYSKLSVKGAPYSVEKNSKYIRLKIGDPASYVKGTVNYTISYSLKVPKYKQSKDSLLLNVVPFGFNTRINSFKINFIMPAEIEKDKIFLVSGSEGTADNQYADLQMDGRTLTITSNGNALPAFNGVSLRLDFPEGTLGNVVDLDALYIFLAGAVIFAIAVIFLFVYGKDEKPVEVVSFTPPDDLPPSEIGYLIDGSVDTNDITSLFFYWASLGCIEIHEDKKDVILVKTNDLPASCRDYERNLFVSIFAGKNAVKIDNLSENFVNKLLQAKKTIKNMYVSKLFTKNSKILSYVVMALSIIFVMAVGLLMDFIKLGTYNTSILFAGLFAGIITGGYYFLGYVLMNKINKLKESKKKILYFLLYGLLGVVVAILGMFVLNKTQNYTLWESLCMVLCPILTCWISPYIHKRTTEYNKLLGDILGFRNFILTAEKDKLEALVKDDPEYFYNILPYANVLGVSNVLEDKFKDIPTTLPYWYYTNNSLGLIDIYIYSRIARTISMSVATQVSAQIARTASSKVSKFGGGVGGGGFRGGGGFGGGGGGRW